MIPRIKNKIEAELLNYIKDLDEEYRLKQISPVLFNHIKEFILRRGKRIRPTLFTIGYLGFAKKRAPGLYRSAVSIELLHDFMLTHDDIIDKSSTRRGKPSMHAMLDNYLKKFKNLRFSGQDLTIVIGDIIYAMAIHSFLAIKEKLVYKERALKKLIEAAFYTGSGEFIELIYNIEGIDSFTKEQIYKIYDLKTANYTFAAPLTIGATLARAPEVEIKKLYSYGIYIGRAFQIKDDIQGIFSEESEIGKPNLTDLREGKKTILIWSSYRSSPLKDKLYIKRILSRGRIKRNDLLKIRSIIKNSGSLEYAKKQISILLKKANSILEKSKITPLYKDCLAAYVNELLV